ncbi:MAG: sensor histidine kinase KdpD [Acetobacteraceae bacterium]
MPEDGRPDPDALVAAAAREGKGRLKVFLGSAPGVGKTWEMLVQAKRRLQHGVDVLAGVIETHGRAGTQAELEGIPILPYRDVAYRGQLLTEFDLDAALARRPGLLLIDELAHTNAPGSRHAKRWEDVETLLAAGLDVWATLNIQHLESLNEDVARITGIRVAETLPDRVLEAADEVELIDVPPTELRARLREGKIYRPDNAARALDGFFKEGNLAALREIALRRTAAYVDDDVRTWMRRAGVPGPWPAGDRVLALVGPDKGAEGVVRNAKRLAEALRAPWTALHVERDNTIADAGPALELAAQLGADVQTRVSSDLVRTAVDIARDTNVTHLVIGRTQSALWRRLTGRTLSTQLLRHAPDFVIHVIPLPGTRLPRRRRQQEGWAAWAMAGALVPVITALGVLLRGVVPGDAMGLAYLAAVVAGASLGGLRPALAVGAAGFLAWDFFFIPPIYTITIGNVHDALALALFAFVSVLSGSLAGRVRAEARAAEARMAGLRRVATFSRKLGEAATEPELMAEIARQAAATAGDALVLAPTPAGLELVASEPAAARIEEGAWAAARWSWTNQEGAGQGTGTLPGSPWRFVPLRTTRARLGVLGVHSPARLNEPQLQALAALADQAAVAWERVRLAVDSARTAAMEETQRLRTALLASLGHDLRTPLTSIQGAAGTLRAHAATLDEATRTDLLDAIEQDVRRMARFLANITELTRLETGEIKPHLIAVPLGEAAEAAIAHLPGSQVVAVTMADPEPIALADPALLERVLVNILENAMKYAPSSSMIQIRGTSEAGHACLAILDEGVGIKAEDLPHVFDSFFRATRGDRIAPGTGLGLAIARGLIEAMHGTITAHSPRPDLPRDGAPGTVITLRLPSADIPA